jgi:hypothetical protein
MECGITYKKYLAENRKLPARYILYLPSIKKYSGNITNLRATRKLYTAHLPVLRARSAKQRLNILLHRLRCVIQARIRGIQQRIAGYAGVTQRSNSGHYGFVPGTQVGQQAVECGYLQLVLIGRVVRFCGHSLRKLREVINECIKALLRYRYTGRLRRRAVFAGNSKTFLPLRLPCILKFIELASSSVSLLASVAASAFTILVDSFLSGAKLVSRSLVALSNAVLAAFTESSTACASSCSLWQQVFKCLLLHVCTFT